MNVPREYFSDLNNQGYKMLESGVFQNSMALNRLFNYGIQFQPETPPLHQFKKEFPPC